ncbi:RimK family alpha-L-glutamate ligase [Bradyrhizobium sp. STM 3566]|uniref:RimK family alpha-L-glutamate ligase n=1 Tax=Bradyrhizobium sp. STM 3566 TaxID=578928 RepID=UPI00388E22CF
MRLLILTSRADCLGENDVLISNAFRRFGWEVIFGEINAIAADDYRYFTQGVTVQGSGEPRHVSSAAQETLSVYFFDECQLIWANSEPHSSVARDVWQMLWLASQHTAFVNSIEGMMLLNTKHALGYLVPKNNRAYSYASNDFSLLSDRYQQSPDQWWVAKPPNASCGQNVFLLPPNGPNVRTILQCLTGNAFGEIGFRPLPEQEFRTVIQRQPRHGLSGFKAEYAILQQFIPEVAQGEKRVIVVCGQATAWHGRKRRADDHRSNIAQGGKAIPVDLHSGEIELAELIGQKLMEHGINFVGIDLAYPYVMEVNIADPGGLYDAQLASGIDRSDKVAELIIDHFQKSHSPNEV